MTSSELRPPRVQLATRALRKSAPTITLPDVTTVKQVFEWTLNTSGFAEEGLKEPGVEYSSDLFISYRETRDEWCLTLYPGGRADDCKDYFSVYLTLMSGRQPQLPIRFELSLLNPNTNEVIVKREKEKKIIKGMASGWDRFVKSKMVTKVTEDFKDDEIKVRCELDFDVKPRDTQSEQLLSSIPIVKDLWLCFKDSKFCDATVLAGNAKFHVHRLVLAARSSVLCSMLESADSIKSDGSGHGNLLIKIVDVEPEVVRSMLQFIYTDRITINETKKAEELLAAATKYELDGLRVKCENLLLEKLNVNNAASTLITADRFNAEDLKEEAMRFINVYLAEVVESPGYKDLENKHMYLLRDLLRAQAAEKKVTEGHSVGRN